MTQEPGVGSRRRYLLGNAVRARRMSLGLTQEQVVERAEIDRKTLSRLENGHTGTSIDVVWVVADALECAPAELFEAAAEATEEL